MQNLQTKYKITKNEGTMPNQIEGEISDGRFFYFRARHKYATLHFGATLDDAYDGEIVWEGAGNDYGWMDTSEFEKLFWNVISEVEK